MREKHVWIVLIGLLALRFGEAKALAFDKAQLKNRFVVEFNKGADAARIEYHISAVAEESLLLNSNVSFVIHHRYSFGNYRGYAATFNLELVDFVQKDPIVRTVFQDDLFRYLDCDIQPNARWGLDRISKDTPENLDQTFFLDDYQGLGVNAYVVDSGINVAHEEFNGRAILGPNFIPDTENTDCNGHGTHVAGLIGSNTYGPAKKVTLISVKISPCKGGGPISAVLAGLEWVYQDHAQKQQPSVINMSLGARKGTFESAVETLIEAGVVVVAAAGNSNADACLVSPACVPNAITVASTTIEDNDADLLDVRSTYSNWGECVSIFAPGELLESTWWETPTSLKTLSGTSMASPLTAGIVANILSNPNLSKDPAQVKQMLLELAQKDTVDIECETTKTPELCSKTPNFLLHQPCSSLWRREL